MFGFGRTRSAPAAPALAAVSRTETGLVRKHNEDGLWADVARRAFAVADGMGGGAEGERASAFVCAAITQAVLSAGDDAQERQDAVMRALEESSEAIFDYAAARGYRQMGTTAAVLLFDGADLACARVGHVGDSRVYRIRSGMAEPLTRDHSVGFALGDFAGADAQRFRDRANPLAHVLTRAVGVEKTVRCDWRRTDVRPGDRFLLCTDGVHDVVSDARLAVFASGGTLESAAGRLADEVVRCGAPDNFTFHLVEVRA